MASTVRFDADAVASATFAAARRGYDPDEVRSYLRSLSGELARLTHEADDLRAQLAHRSSPAVDEASIAAALGEEAARLLTTARDASHQIRARAEEQANETMRVAQTDAERLRRDADIDAAERRRVANEESDAMIDAAKTEGREMLAEARAVRERMLDDISRRREKARGQLEMLRASHERVVRSMEMATASLELVSSDLRALGPEVGSNANLEPNDSGPVPLIPGVEFQPLAQRTSAAEVVVDEPTVLANDPLPPVQPTAIEVVVPRRVPDIADVVEDVAAEPVAEPVAEALAAASVDGASVGSEGAGEVDDEPLVVRSFSLGELPPERQLHAPESHAPKTPAQAPPALALVGEPAEPVDVDVDVDDRVGDFGDRGVDDHDDHDQDHDGGQPHQQLPSADDLFARIRAARSSLREHTSELLGPTSVTVLDHDVDGGRRSMEPVERLLASTPTLAAVPEPAIAAPGVVTREPGVVAIDALRPVAPAHAGEIVAARDAALAPIEVSLGRHLKRVLADEQNEVLDRIRRAKTVGSVDDVLGSATAQAESYRNAIEPDLWAAIVAGAQSLETELERDQVATRLDRATIVATVGDYVVSELVAPLRERLARCMVETDRAETTDLARAAFREWKAQRIDAVASQLSLQAFGRGAFAILAPGAPVCWVADPSGQPCPDGDDNVLGGAVPAGSSFPTGHTFAPAYTGCRCMLARP